jgi:hypothetical protein
MPGRYNRLNGTHCSESQELLRNILRGDWKSKATVMSDWFGVYSIDHAINAGLDLVCLPPTSSRLRRLNGIFCLQEMPGINKWRSVDLVTRSIQSRKIMPRTLKERAKNVLRLVQKCAAGAPEVFALSDELAFETLTHLAQVLDGDGKERSVDSDEDTKLMRQLASQAIVLLKNEGGLLPLQSSEQSIKKVAIVGGNAKAIALSGGGSAALKPSYFVSPYDGIANALGKNVEVVYAEGAVGEFLSKRNPNRRKPIFQHTSVYPHSTSRLRLTKASAALLALGSHTRTKIATSPCQSRSGRHGCLTRRACSSQTRSRTRALRAGGPCVLKATSSRVTRTVSSSLA